jgi:hypothetical protein
VRPDEYQLLRGLCESGLINSRLQSWLVRLDGSSDWLEEQEWRIPLLTELLLTELLTEPYEPALQLQALGLKALLVGDPDWSPAHSGLPPQIVAGVPRSWSHPVDGLLYLLPPPQPPLA